MLSLAQNMVQFMLQHCRAHRRLGTWAPATTGVPYYRVLPTLEAP